MLASKSEKERRFAVNVIKKIKEGADLGDFLACHFRLPMSTLMQPVKLDQLGIGEAIGTLGNKLLVTTTVILVKVAACNYCCKFIFSLIQK